MGQSKTKSLIEQILNIASGFVVSIIVWIYIIVPVWNIEVTMTDNISITLVFTTISIIRGYVWRRLFNWIDHRPRMRHHLEEDIKQ